MLTTVRNRLYADFAMPSRLDAYRRLLERALAAGYEIVSLERFWQLVSDGPLDPSARYLILRHDVDTDPGTAAEMWRIEQELSIRGSYYFRLSTLDRHLMRSIRDGGAEAGYHYEELATLAKRTRARRPEEALALVPAARAELGRNLASLRAATGLPLRVVASHGDFVNRAVGVANTILLDDASFRASVGVDLEAYDAPFLAYVTSRHSDTHHPRYWVGEDPADAIGRGEPVVHVLVHPRHWRVSRRINALDDLGRVREGLVHRFGGAVPGRRPLPPWRTAEPVPAAPAAPADEPSGTPSGLTVAMALYADVTFDSRVQREAEALARAGHRVTIYCLAGAAPPGSPYAVVAHRPGASSVLPDGSSPFLRAGGSSPIHKVLSRVRWMAGYLRNIRAWGRWVAATAGTPDVWHAHDLTGLLAVGPLVKRPARLVYDSHEIFLETGTAARLPGPLRRVLSMYEGRLARRAVALVTVNDRYAEVLKQRLRPRRILIVRNCPPVWVPPAEHEWRLRDAIGIGPDVPLVLYHGSFAHHRGIEQVADAMLEPGLEGAHLALLGFGAQRDQLDGLTKDPRFAGRLHLVDAVPPSELLSWVIDADVDAIPLQHSTLNHWLCTPNKLWESLAAGVPVVVSDFPGMRPIVLDDPSGPLGAVCDPADPGSIATSIRTIIDRPAAERAELRARCLAAAHDRWNWEAESATLIRLYAALEQARADGPPHGPPKPEPRPDGD